MIKNLNESQPVSKLESVMNDIKCMYFSNFLILNYNPTTAHVYAYLSDELELHRQSENLIKGNYFPKTQKEIASDCNLSVKKVRVITNLLEKEGYIETKLFQEAGAKTKHYSVNSSIIEERSKYFDAESYCERKTNELIAIRLEVNRKRREKRRLVKVLTRKDKD